MLQLHFHVHWAYVHNVQDYFVEYLHTYGSPLHCDITLGYLNNGSDWLQVGQTWFYFLEAVGVFKLSVTMSRLALGHIHPPVQLYEKLFYWKKGGHTSPFSAKVKNLWSFISIIIYAYMAWCLDTGTMFTALLTLKF